MVIKKRWWFAKFVLAFDVGSSYSTQFFFYNPQKKEEIFLQSRASEVPYERNGMFVFIYLFKIKSETQRRNCVRKRTLNPFRWLKSLRYIWYKPYK